MLGLTLGLLALFNFFMDVIERCLVCIYIQCGIFSHCDCVIDCI